ncbi:hypothetical protein CBW24_11775 [Pacificitalea manganoxidans]|uniref:Excalibur calcium-binding domain-containing protein n=2 Tax=Pacificitalea manganoxidans TaxID=1411902 RepID=A0A291M394_9RHOB|nr:hypothetical protein CBW24_11775 [Pacificitalea manganoxidans]MBF52462.1 hypothetical protein [Actibacterium sp.]
MSGATRPDTAAGRASFARLGLGALALTLVAACQPEVPDSAAGVGFGDYTTYREARDAELRTSDAVLPPEATGAPAVRNGAIVSAPLSAPGTSAAAVLPAPAGVADQGVTVAVTPPRVAGSSDAAISDEQSFQAVSARESIESDAERLERQRAAYVQVEATPVPQRTGDAGPNIVAYALSTTNAKGQPVYSRGLFTSDSRAARNCAQYPSPDLAQIAFLKAGGPQKDRMSLDPDGDGYACGWDPAPFRAVRG